VIVWCAAACGDGSAGNLADAPQVPGPPLDAADDAPDPDTTPPRDARGCRLDGHEVCGNGIDDDCDGSIDEDCPCTPGSVQRCSAGVPAQRQIGACVDGEQVCLGSPGAWSACRGGIAPSAERCDGVDNDCNGETDEQLTCSGALACPAPGALPDGQLFHDYVIDGTRLFGGDAQRWTWTVSGGPCEQLFTKDGKPSSLELRGTETSQLTFKPKEQGDYVVTVTIVTGDGETLGCSFVVHVAGVGLRVDLCWDTSGIDDVDLHVHRPASAKNWFTGDDCFYRNCKGSSKVHASWGYDASPLAACVDGPDGTSWAALGRCLNPRLDIDNIATQGRPEGITIDLPQSGATYRAMAHYFAGIASTHPLANLYCQGRLVASFGQAPDLVENFDTSGVMTGSMWRVADVTTRVDGGTTACEVHALHPAGQATGYDVRLDDTSF